MKKHIKYKSGYKYQLHEDYHDKVEIHPNKDIETEYTTLDINGNLLIKKEIGRASCRERV